MNEVSEEVMPSAYGMSKVYKQITKPTIKPDTAPVREPLRQNSAPKKDGANCAIMTNATKPMENKL